jgi:hypothetical protein
MSSRIEMLRRKVARAARSFAALVCAAGCSASGDQVLGNIRPEPPPVPDASASHDAAAACTSFMSSEARETGFDLDIYFTIDRSSSMADRFGDKWDLFVSGFTRFLHSSSADGVGIGLGFFPSPTNQDACNRCPPRDCGCLASCGCPCDAMMNPRPCQRGPICDPDTYDQADVDIATIPGNAGALATSLSPFPFGPTVMRPALRGALEYTGFFTANHKDDRVYDVLVAGGPPSTDICAPDTVDDVANVAAASNTRTFVVAFDYQGPSLDLVADKGGGRLFSIDPRAEDVALRFASLVQELRAEGHCDYEIPQGVDFGKVNVEITLPDDAGTATTFVSYQVKNRDACGASLGWYYDRSDRPTRIVACPAACRKIHGPPEATVVLKTGCPTLPPP